MASPTKNFRRRDVKQSPLWQILRDHLPAFIRECQKNDRYLPRFVEAEFEAFLACGTYDAGASLVRCRTCGHRQLIPFSCGSRSLCSSCSTRRMQTTAKRLVDEVFPRVPARQWVVTFPAPVRFLLAYDAALVTQALSIYVESIYEHYRTVGARELERPRSELHCGSVTVIQRAGSSLQSTLHFHTAAMDGVWARDPDSDELRFHAMPDPSKAELAQVAWRTCEKLTKLLQKQGIWEDERYQFDDLSVVEDPLLAESLSASIGNAVAIGPGAGRRVARVGQLFPEEAESSESKGPTHGYNLHASTRVSADDRKGLGRLLRYMLSPPVSTERLSYVKGGTGGRGDHVVYRLKRAWSDGTTAVRFSPLDFISKLMALIPRPGKNLVRYHGIFAPQSKLRGEVVAKVPKPATKMAKRAPKQLEFGGKVTAKGSRWVPREVVLVHAFGEDFGVCPRCKGQQLEILSVLTRPDAVRAVAYSLGLGDEALGSGSARGPPQLDLDFTAPAPEDLAA